MCIGIPMKVVKSGTGYAICEHQGKSHQIDMQVVGDQPAGTWVLTFLNAAREVISEEDARKISDALLALDMALSGNANFDHLFADLVDREPFVPDHLRDQIGVSPTKQEKV